MSNQIFPHPVSAPFLILIFFTRFWEVLGYLANTLIFVLVGVVISQRAFEGGLDLRDWMFLIALYLTIIVIR